MVIEKTKFVFGMATGAMMVFAASVSADTVQDQSAFDKNAYGWDSVADNGHQQIADDFQLKSAGKIVKLNWTGKYHDAVIVGIKSFEIIIFADQKGVPGEIVHVETVKSAGVDTGVSDIGQHKLLSYKTSLKRSPRLDMNRTYWLTIRESDSTTKSRWSWSFHSGHIAGGFSYRLGLEKPWSVGRRDMAYALTVSHSH